MVIKSSKSFHIYALLLICCSVMLVFPFFDVGADIKVVVLIVLCMMLYTFRFWITYGRKLILDKQGCTVQFFFYRHTYLWSEMKTKRIEIYDNRIKNIRYWEPYSSGVVFSKKSVRNLKKLMPAAYGMLLHPFSFVFINFKPNINIPYRVNYVRDLYEVEEDELLKKLNEWGVSLR